MEELLNEQKKCIMNISDEAEEKGFVNKEYIKLLRTKNIELDTITLMKLLRPMGYTLKVVPLNEKAKKQ